jgi:hypothetical protein
VAADVLARGEEHPAGVEERRPVEPAGLGKDRLLVDRRRSGSASSRRRSMRQLRRDDRRADGEVGDRALAADAAARRGVEGAFDQLPAAGQVDGDDVLAIAFEQRFRVGERSDLRRARGSALR